MIGQLVELTSPMLSNKIHTVGVCYEEYCIGIYSGKSYIFENGEYDGFSTEDQDEFLRILGKYPLQYTSTNVMRLSDDFRRGVFKDALDEAKRLQRNRPRFR